MSARIPYMTLKQNYEDAAEAVAECMILLDEIWKHIRDYGTLHQGDALYAELTNFIGESHESC